MPRPHRFRTTAAALALGLALAAAGCARVPVTSLYQLSRFDPLESDPAQLRVAVRLPQTIEPRGEGVRLTLAVWRDGEEAARDEAAFLLDALAVPEAAARFARPGDVVRVFALAAADHERFATAVDEMVTLAERPDHSGSLSVSVRVCHSGAEPPAAVPVSAYLAAAELDGFVPLLEDADLLREMPAGSRDSLVPACG